MQNTKTKIAFVTKDGKNLVGAFGSSRYFSVYTLDNGKVLDNEIREVFKDDAGEQLNPIIQKNDPNPNSFGKFSLNVMDKSKEKHMKIAKSISDCDVIVARAMCENAKDSIIQFEMKPVVTKLKSFDEGLEKYLEGSLVQ